MDAVPDLADEGGPRLRMLVHISCSNQHGAFLGSTYWVTRAVHGPERSSTFPGTGRSGLGQELLAAGTRVGRHLQGYVVRDQNATVCVPISRAAGSGNGLHAAAAIGVFTEAGGAGSCAGHVSGDLPWDMRGVVSVARTPTSSSSGLREELRAEHLKQIQSFGYLTKNAAPTPEPALRAQGLYWRPSPRADVARFFHRTAPIGDSPFFLFLQSSASGLCVGRARRLLSGTCGRFDLNRRRQPWRGSRGCR
jgi:hypothetical protein